MPQNLLAIHGVEGLVVAVGEHGRILHFTGDDYQVQEPGSPTQATLRGVWVESPSRAWAVGDGVLLQWTGRQWLPISLTAPRERYAAIWGCPEEGIWFGGERTLVNHRTDGSGGTLIATDTPIRAIWGSGPRDMFFLSGERTLLHWDGQGCAGEALPGDPDEEWNAVTGSGPDEPVYIVGVSGLVMEWDRSKWFELSTDTPDLLTGAVSNGADSLWVCTEAGQVQHWDGIGWRTAGFSAFGSLNAITMVDGVVWACGSGGVVLQHLPDDGADKE